VQDVIYHDGVRELRGTKLLSVVSVPALGRPRQEDSSLGYTLREALLEKEYFHFCVMGMREASGALIVFCMVLFYNGFTHL
jgi:hypothetical protein